MKIVDKKNSFQKFVHENYPNLLCFSNIHAIPYPSVYAIYIGKRMPKRALAFKIVKASEGKLTMKDFGFD